MLALPEPNPADAPQPCFRFTAFQAPARWTSRGSFDTWRWVEVVHHVRSPELWPSAASIDESLAQLPGWSFAQYADNARVVAEDPGEEAHKTAARVEAVHGLAVEYVDDPAVDAEHIEQWWGRWQYVAHTTAHHRQWMGHRPPGSRWRVLIPFTRSTTLEEARQVARWARSPHRDAGIIDAITEEVWRYYPAPAIVPGGHRWSLNEGEFLDPDEAIEQMRGWAIEDRVREAEACLARTTVREVVDHWTQRWPDAQTSAWLGDPGSRDAAPTAEDVLPSPADTARREWPSLSRVIGRLWPGRVAVMVGPPGSGRTAFALQLAESAARAGSPVLFVPAAAGAREITARWIALRARSHTVHHAALLAGGVDRDVVRQAGRSLAADCPGLHVWTRRNQRRSADAVEDAVSALAVSTGQPPLVVFDPAPFIRSDWWDTVADIARPGGLAPEWAGASVLAVCPLPPGAASAFASPDTLSAWSAGLDDRATALEELDPELATLADEASVLLGLTVDHTSERAGVAVLANRHGRRGYVPLRFHAGQGRFEEVAPDD